MLPRGGGSSQAGQTVNASLVIDCSKHLTRILDLDVAGRRCQVEPGIVLDDLNRALRPHGLWFPVDVSTASRATIGGMTANNSCGGRSLRYGNTRENVLSVDAMLADGSKAHFGPVAADLSDLPATVAAQAAGARSVRARRARGRRDRGALSQGAAPRRRLQHRCAGAGTQRRQPRAHPGRLGGHAGILHRDRTEALAGARPPRRRCRVTSAASTRRWRRRSTSSSWRPIAVELVDSTMIALAREIAMFRPTLEAFVRGEPAALLLVEFAEAEWEENVRRLARLHELIGDLGFDWKHAGDYWGGVVDVLDPKLQARDHRAAHRRPQHHDVDEGCRKAGLLRRGLRGAARASRRLHRAAHRRVREERHHRHLVRARLGRLPARAADPQPAARQGRQGDAQHRRAGVCIRARIQGLALRRARRRPGALGVQRADVRLAARARVRGGEGPLRSGGPVQSRQDRARAEVRRPHELPLRARLCGAGR